MTRSLVIFDVDGTLIDSQDLIVAAIAGALTGSGLPVPARDRILSIVGLSLREAMAELAPGQSPAIYDALTECYRDYVRSQRRSGAAEGSAPFYPGARQMLDQLKQTGYLLGIATGKARPGIDHFLDTHALHHIFDTVQTADAHPSKPDPSMVRAAMAAVGAAPEHAVMIGDTEFDMAMGRAAGAHTVGVTWGYHPKDRLGMADRLITGFPELQSTLDELLAVPS